MCVPRVLPALPHGATLSSESPSRDMCVPPCSRLMCANALPLAASAARNVIDLTQFICRSYHETAGAGVAKKESIKLLSGAQRDHGIDGGGAPRRQPRRADPDDDERGRDGGVGQRIGRADGVEQLTEERRQ